MLVEFPVTSMESEDLITTNERLFKVTSDPFSTMLSNRFLKTNAASENLAKALNKNNKSGYTPRLASADNVRDDGYRCIKFAVLSATFNQDPAIKAAGKRLLTVLKSHNTTLYSLGYVSQTADMKSLKLDLDEMTKDLPLVTVSKQELSRQLIMLLRQVQIMEDDEVEGIDELVNNYNETITTIMSAVKARKTREQNTSSTDDETEES